MYVSYVFDSICSGSGIFRGLICVCRSIVVVVDM